MERAARHDGTGDETSATLYVVATPIGNLKDITLRALETLRSVDAIAAEDTRVTSRLLAHYDIAVEKLMALHEHNEARVAPRIVEALAAGRSVALVSDAGTPGFSDPGARVVAAVREAGYRVVPIPGANAAAAALSASGFVDSRFLFCGFLPSRPGERRRAIEALANERHALVFYEAPHRITDTVDALAAVLGGARRIVLARELTKLFETIHADRLEDARRWLDADAHRIKGEFVLIVEGAPAPADTSVADAQRTVEILLEALPVSQAAALAAKITGARRKDLYELALRLKSGAPDA